MNITEQFLNGFNGSKEETPELPSAFAKLAEATAAEEVVEEAAAEEAATEKVAEEATEEEVSEEVESPYLEAREKLAHFFCDLVEADLGTEEQPEEASTLPSAFRKLS